MAQHPSPTADTNSESDHSIALSGSADTVTDFFNFGVNALLYQRGIYPPEDFTRVSKYGLTLLMNTIPGVKKFIDENLTRMTEFLNQRDLKRVIVVIQSIATKKVLERWAFHVGLKKAPDHRPQSDHPVRGSKEEKKIVAEIQAVLRQISASVSFLPLLDEPCSFDVLLYASGHVDTPPSWAESAPKIIPDREEVQLRSFSTSVHTVDASVSYARAEE